MYADGSGARSSNLNAIPSSQGVSSSSSSNPQSKSLRGSHPGVAVTETVDPHRDPEDVLYGWTDRQWSGSGQGNSMKVEPKLNMAKSNEVKVDEATENESQ